MRDIPGHASRYDRSDHIRERFYVYTDNEEPATALNKDPLEPDPAEALRHAIIAFPEDQIFSLFVIFYDGKDGFELVPSQQSQRAPYTSTISLRDTEMMQRHCYSH